jgi:hypothetical protein
MANESGRHARGYERVVDSLSHFAGVRVATKDG